MLLKRGQKRVTPEERGTAAGEKRGGAFFSCFLTHRHFSMIFYDNCKYPQFDFIGWDLELADPIGCYEIYSFFDGGCFLGFV